MPLIRSDFAVHRILAVSALAAWLAGCSGAEAPPPLPAPAAEPEAPTPSPEAEPEPSLEERWREPFAVQSSGQIVPRAPRVLVAVTEPTAARAAPAPAPDTAAPPAAAAAQPQPRTPTPPSTPAPAARREDPRVHTVASGETFYGIALRHGVTYSELLEANPGTDPQRIRIGQTLRIPRAGARPAPRQAARRVHQVVAGETLWGIARRYGVSPERIRTANKLPDDRVRIGQTLIIPEREGVER